MLTDQGETVSVAAAWTSLGRLHHERRHWAESGKAYGRALELYLAAGVTGPEAALCRNGMGAAAFDAGRRKEATAYFEQALEGLGDAPRFAPVRAAALANLGRAALAAGDMDRAENLFRQALELQQKTLGPRHPDVALTLRFQAQAAAMRGDKALSKALMRQARDIQALADEANGGGATVDVSAWMEQE
jgi:tetratricopeptide (TPR) repeat protein